MKYDSRCIASVQRICEERHCSPEEALEYIEMSMDNIMDKLSRDGLKIVHLSGSPEQGIVMVFEG